MRSQEAFNLFQSAREIKVAIVTDGDRVGGLLNDRHPMPVGEGEPAFDYRRHMGQLTNQLDSSVEGVVFAEDAHSEQLIRVSRAQEDRNEVSDASFEKLLSARQSLEGLYKRGGFELAFISGATPKAPKRLNEQLGQTVKLLQQPAVARRNPKIKGFNVDLEEVAVDLEEARTDLHETLERVDDANKKLEGTQVAKREALDALRRTVGWVGHAAEGLFQLAGETELAQRIRKSTSRPRRPSEVTEEPAPDSQVTAEPAFDSQVADEPVPDSQVADEPAPDSQVADEPAPDSQIP